jgi:hypothetical protein
MYHSRTLGIKEIDKDMEQERMPAMEASSIPGIDIYYKIVCRDTGLLRRHAIRMHQTPRRMRI